MSTHPAESPAKKQSKWSQEEDNLIIHLRGSGMKWEDISKRLPGRSAISCRLHYQNYLEKRSEWDEERKNKLARLYERFKAEMWAKVAEEMAVPWRAAEAMHWQLGEADMARRAGVVPFSLSSVTLDSPLSSSSRSSPQRGHAHSLSQPANMPMLMSMPIPSPHNLRYCRPVAAAGFPDLPRTAPALPPGMTRTIAARRDNAPRSVPLPSPSQEFNLAALGPGPMGRGGPGGQQNLLPSVAEMTTGMSPYSMSAYSMPMVASTSPGQVPLLPVIGSGGGRGERGVEGKRRASGDEGGCREQNRPRH